MLQLFGLALADSAIWCLVSALSSHLPCHAGQGSAHRPRQTAASKQLRMAEFVQRDLQAILQVEDIELVRYFPSLSRLQHGQKACRCAAQPDCVHPWHLAGGFIPLLAALAQGRGIMTAACAAAFLGMFTPKIVDQRLILGPCATCRLFVLGLLSTDMGGRRTQGTSVETEVAVQQLRPFLGAHADHFWHEVR